MSEDLYDLVALDTRLSTLVAVALLARRGLRVLVLFDPDERETYELGGFRFLGHPFVFCGSEFPVWRRIVDELGMAQLIKHRMKEASPMYQVALGRERIDVYGRQESFREELSRVWKNEESPITLFYDLLERYDAELDKLLVNDIVIPAQSFFERRELARASVQNPFEGKAKSTDLLSRWNRSHPFRIFVEAQAGIAGASGSQSLSALRLVRLHRSWIRGIMLVEDGLTGLKRQLLERITLYGGVFRQKQRAEELILKGSRVNGVRVSGEDEYISTRYVLSGLPSARLNLLVRPMDRPSKFASRNERVIPGVWRYSVNIGLERGVVPNGMGSDLICIFDGPGSDGPENVMWISRIPQEDDDYEVLCAAVDLPYPPDRDLLESGELRDGVLDRVREIVPFMDEGLVLVHSPWDSVAPAFIGSKPPDLAPPPQFPHEYAVYPAPSSRAALGIEGLHHRTGIRKLVSTGREVLPGLGQEGEILTGWGAASIISRAESLRIPLMDRVLEKLDI